MTLKNPCPGSPPLPPIGEPPERNRLVPGGSVTDPVCYADPAQRGRYIVLWQSSLIGGSRAAWPITG